MPQGVAWTELTGVFILGAVNDVDKWLKPAKGDFRIYYAHDDEYVPDLAVETKNARYLCELKGRATK